MENRKSEFEIYNMVYDNDVNYAKPHKPKINYVINWSGQKNKILDIGCGRGEYLREVSKNNSVFGIELSKSCCDKYLKDVNHECIDIISYCDKLDFMYDKAYCVDVLEHIRPNELDETLMKISQISNEFMFLVCSGSDIKMGVELHVSNHTFEEWEKILSKYYTITKSIKGFDEWPYIHIFELKSKN